MTVEPALLAVTATDLTRSYGSANPPLSFTITGFVNGDSISVVSGAPVLSTTATAGSSVGVYPITISAGTLIAANYSFPPAGFVGGSLSVIPAALTITALSASRQAGQPNPAFGVSYTGFVNGDTNGVLTSLPVAASTADSSSPPGHYPIVASGATSLNYTIAYLEGILVVTAAAAKVERISIETTGHGRREPARLIVIQFTGAINEAAAQNSAEYALAGQVKRNRTKPIPISGAMYNAGTQSVTLKPRRKNALKLPLRLSINAAALGLAESAVVATIRNSGTTVTES